MESKNSSSIALLEQLPSEILVHVFSFLLDFKSQPVPALVSSFQSLTKIRLLNRWFYDFVEDSKLQRQLISHLVVSKKTKKNFKKELFRICGKIDCTTKKDLQTLYCLLKSIEINDKILDINSANRSNNTPLMLAACSHCKFKIDIMLRCISKLDVDRQIKIINAKNTIGENVIIMAACNQDNQYILTSLLDFMDHFPIDIQYKIISAKTSSGNTALIYAAKWNKNALDKLITFIGKFSIYQQFEIMKLKNNDGENIINITNTWRRSYSAELITILQDDRLTFGYK